MAKERRVEIRMPSELLRRIDDQADSEGKSRSEMIRFMAEIYLREKQLEILQQLENLMRDTTDQ